MHNRLCTKAAFFCPPKCPMGHDLLLYTDQISVKPNLVFQDCYVGCIVSDSSSVWVYQERCGYICVGTDACGQCSVVR